MLLDEAERIAYRELKRWGLYDKGWRFEFDNAHTRFGICCYPPIKVISLSKHLVGRNSSAEVIDTILHEIAHALAGPQAKHGDEWKEWCIIVGAKPIACYDSATVARAPHNWEGHCQNIDCDKVYKRQRLRKSIREFARCGKCDIGELKWVRVEQPIKTKRVVEFVDELPD